MNESVTETTQSTADAKPGQNRTVILTGAAGNLGRTITRVLLRDGARVVMTGRGEESLKKFTETLVFGGL